MKYRFLLLAALVSTALTISAEERKIQLWGHVYDRFTHHAIRDAKATLMLSDSTAATHMTNAEAAGGTEDRYLGRLFGLRFTDN